MALGGLVIGLLCKRVSTDVQTAPDRLSNVYIYDLIIAIPWFLQTFK